MVEMIPWRTGWPVARAALAPRAPKIPANVSSRGRPNARATQYASLPVRMPPSTQPSRPPVTSRTIDAKTILPTMARL